MSCAWTRSLLAGMGLGAALGITPALAGAPASAAKAPTLRVAQAQARAQHRALVLEFSTEWCEACQKLEADVLPLPLVKRALAGVIFVRYNAEEGAGVAAAKALKVLGYPTVLALSQDGAEISRFVGLPDTADFITWLESVGGHRLKAAAK